MLLKFLIFLLIICEQVGFVGGTNSLNRLIYKTGSQKILPSTDEENQKEYFLLDKTFSIPSFPLSPLPLKMKEAPAFEVKAASACALDAENAVLLYAKDKDKRLAMASLAKIMTALIILEDNRLNSPVLIKEEYTKVTPEESQLGLIAGDKVQVSDLLYGLLVYSANDAAKALAHFKAGNEEKFIKLMNEKAKNLGLKNTHFSSVTGIDHKDNYSSAYDLALLFKCALSYPLFEKIIQTKDYEFTSLEGHHYLMNNTNELLGRDSRVIGGKTGSTDEAGKCLATLASYNNHRVITVLMNAPDRFSETQRLLDWIYASYFW